MAFKVVTFDPTPQLALTGDVEVEPFSNIARVVGLTPTSFGPVDAKSVFVNATNASAVPDFLVASGAFQYLRVNSTNDALEWATISVTSPIIQTAGVFGFDQTVALDNNARVAVNLNSGATVGIRRRINFIEGSNVSITVTDDAGNEEIDVEVSSTGSGHTIRDDGVDMASRAGLNFVSSTSISAIATDDSVNNETEVTFQRAALTGVITAPADSNTTAFAAAAAKSILVNATNASAVPAFLAGTAAFQYIRVNSGNTGLEWATLSGHASTSIIYNANTFERAALTGAIEASQNSNTTIFSTGASGAGLTGGGTAVLAVGSGTHITVNANDVAVNLTTLVPAIDSVSVIADGTVLERAALSGAIAAAQDSNATLFSGIRDNGSAETDRTNLNFVSSTSATAVVTDDAANDELEITFQRAALTGDTTAPANSNTTAFRSFAAKSVLANATNAAAVPSDLAGSGAFQYLRVNSGNTALEWATISVASPITQTTGTIGFDQTVALGNNARVAVTRNSAATIGTRRKLNFIEGTGVSLTVTDDAGGEEVEVTIATTGVGITDGDKGDITVSAGGTTWTIDASAVTTTKIADGNVTLAKFANQNDDTFLANISGASAAPTAVALTTLAGAGLTGGANAVLAVGAGTGITVNANDVAVTTPLTDGDKGDITVATNGTVFTIDDSAVTLAKMENRAQATVIGRASGAGTGAPQELTAAQVAAIVRSAAWTEVEESGAGPFNDYNAGATTHVHLMCSNAAGVFTGVLGGTAGAMLLISHQGSGYTELQNNNTSTTTPSARFFNGRAGKNLRIRDNEGALYIAADQTAGGTTAIRWMLVSPTFPFAEASDAATGDVVAFDGTTWAVVSGGNSASVVLRGNATFGTVPTAGIADDAVTDAKLRNSAALSVIGRSANSTGDPADIAAANDGQVLRRSGTTLGFGAVANAGLATMAANTVKANPTAGVAVPTDVAISTFNILARLGGNIISHPLNTLAGSGITSDTSGALNLDIRNDYHIIQPNDGISPVEGIAFRKSPARHYWFEDFDYISATGTVTTTGTPVNFMNTSWGCVATTASGAISRQPVSVGHPGVIAIQTSTTDNSRMSLFNGTSATLGDAAYRADSVAQIEMCYSMGSTTSIAVFAGFTDGSAFTNSILFRFDTDSGDTTVQTLTIEGGVSTVKDTGLSPGTGFHVYKIRQDTAQTIDFYIDGVLETTHTSTQNVPDSEPGCVAFICITRTTAARSMEIDYCMFESVHLGSTR